MTNQKVVIRKSAGAESDAPVHLFRTDIYSEWYTDNDGNPKGGITSGEGFDINWQNGVQEPNGAILEDVIGACIMRLDFFQDSRFANEYNRRAIMHLEAALEELDNRTKERRVRGVEGSYNE